MTDDYDVTLTLILNLSKENKKKKEEKGRDLNKETSIQALHVWQIGLFIISIDYVY